MTDCWECEHLEKRTGGFQYCLANNGRRNVDANHDHCDDHQTMTQPLSPTAQAVLTAANAAYWSTEVMCPNDADVIAVAAIRALVEQTLPEERPPLMMRGHELERLCERQHLRTQQLAVAAELEGVG